MHILKQHQSKCDSNVKYVCPGGVYENKSSMLDELRSMGIHVNEELRVEKWFACFDFEAYQCDFKDGMDEEEEGTTWKKVHVPVSFSVGCNVEGFGMVHVNSKEPEELVSRLVDVLLEMSEWKYVACVERFEDVFNALKENMRIEESRIDEDNAVNFHLYGMSEDDVEVDDDGNNESEYLKKLKNLYGYLEGYCRELAVFGFNSAGYDLKLIKQYLFRELCQRGE